MKQTRSWIAVCRAGDARDALMIFAIVALAGLVALHLFDVQRAHPQFDGDIYRMMAEHPRTFYVAPYSLRVLTPWLVWMLPLSTRTGFALTTVVCVAGAAAVLFLYVRTFGNRAAALRAVAFFGLTGWVVLLFVDPWLVDAPTMLLSILTFLLVRRGHIGWAGVTASAAVASHESALVMLIPLAVAHYFERGRRFDARLIPFVGMPILVYLLIRCTPLVYGYIPPSALFQDFDYLSGQFGHRLRLDGGIGNAMLFTISASFGAIWVLAALGFRGAPRFQRLTTLMIPFVLVLPIFGSDWDRLLTVAFPVVIPLAARVRLRWWILALFLGVQTAIAALTIERVSTLYNDYNVRLPTGHFENRNPALTSVLLGTGVILAIFGAARSRTLRTTVTLRTQA